MKKFENKTVWITGASSGIGEALAHEFAKEGARLVLSARNEVELQRVAESCGRADTIIQTLDLANHDSLPGIVAAVLTKAGSIDVLVNNGGISQRSLAKDTKFEVDKKLINVNLLGTIALSKAILPHFLERKSGHFVVITSLTGKFGTQLRSSYAAAKHGLHGFFDSLRAEVWRENVLVTLVCPGFISTKVSVNALTGNGSPQGSMDNATRAGKSPQDLAKAIVSAVSKGKYEIYYGGRELIGVYVKRFFPRIFTLMLRKAKVT
ncbi:MAG: SDR family oxidoreductase [Saprospiraceae bacterium]|nr:SDR family oxidoreductase [Saprospiraceae bacterium]MCF8250413.1 SDR family oxidoreductase [Saprospiraceae bacterium]MCF8280667.1 SDR family oxidoreductase [Bacteroidales bacterium]MCF8312212.1 SDR family oxidoreductase [Saprospiraceae bacterium]MCF8440553.1 SDR family oxidoreductase [Saprospiraceae bacterium]